MVKEITLGKQGILTPQKQLPEVFYKIFVLKNFSIFRALKSFLLKMQAWAATLLKLKLLHSFLYASIAEFLEKNACNQS